MLNKMSLDVPSSHFSFSFLSLIEKLFVIFELTSFHVIFCGICLNDFIYLFLHCLIWFVHRWCSFSNWILSFFFSMSNSNSIELRLDFLPTESTKVTVRELNIKIDLSLFDTFLLQTFSLICPMQNKLRKIFVRSKNFFYLFHLYSMQLLTMIIYQFNRYWVKIMTSIWK